MKTNEREAKRPPLGITILVILQVIVGVFWLIKGGQNLILNHQLYESLSQRSGLSRAIYYSYFSSYFEVGLASLIASIISFLIGYGLFRLKKWAWFLYLTLLGISTISTLANLTSISSILVLIFNAAIIYFLMRPDVKRSFAHKSDSPETEGM